MTRVLLAGLTLALAASVAFRPGRTPAPRTGKPRLDGDHLITSDGAQLTVARWLPQGEPDLLILGLHSYGDYRAAFNLAGPWFAARDVALFAYDQRGFGQSDSRGVWPGTDVLVHDLRDAVTVVREQHPDQPLVLLGESMGGSVALSALGRGVVEGVKALIVAAPGVRGDMPMRQLHDLALRLGALALPWLAVELRRGGRPWLDPAEAERLADDPLILRELSVGTYDGLVELASEASSAAKVDPPSTLILYGALDTTIPHSAIEVLARRLGEQSTLKIYPDRHHLLLHEIGADQVFADCWEWLRAHALKR